MSLASHLEFGDRLLDRPRFNVGQLMGIVLYLGLGFAALRSASDFWASATFGVAIVMVLGASLGAAARRGVARMTWAGFALFGWAYLLLSVLPPRRDNFFGFGPIPWPYPLMRSLISQVAPYIRPPSGFDYVHDQVIYSLQLILFGLVGAVVGRVVAVKDEQPNP